MVFIFGTYVRTAGKCFWHNLLSEVVTFSNQAKIYLLFPINLAKVIILSVIFKIPKWLYKYKVQNNSATLFSIS